MAFETFTPAEWDRLVRTVLGEGGGSEWVLANRMRAGGFGDNVKKLTHYRQFETWDPKKFPNGHKPRMVSADSPEYRAAAMRMATALSGEGDPTNGALYFYGRTKSGRPPSFHRGLLAKGGKVTTNIGGNTFIKYGDFDTTTMFKPTISEPAKTGPSAIPTGYTPGPSWQNFQKNLERTKLGKLFSLFKNNGNKPAERTKLGELFKGMQAPGLIKEGANKNRPWFHNDPVALNPESRFIPPGLYDNARGPATRPPMDMTPKTPATPASPAKPTAFAPTRPSSVDVTPFDKLFGTRENRAPFPSAYKPMVPSDPRASIRPGAFPAAPAPRAAMPEGYKMGDFMLPDIVVKPTTTRDPIFDPFFGTGGTPLTGGTTIAPKGRVPVGPGGGFTLPGGPTPTGLPTKVDPLSTPSGGGGFSILKFLFGG